MFNQGILTPSVTNIEEGSKTKLTFREATFQKALKNIKDKLFKVLLE